MSKLKINKNNFVMKAEIPLIDYQRKRYDIIAENANRFVHLIQSAQQGLESTKKQMDELLVELFPDAPFDAVDMTQIRVGFKDGILTLIYKLKEPEE